MEELTRIVSTIRLRWLNVRIIVPGDSGFCQDNIQHWCEDTTVDYVIGLAKNDRLIEAVQTELAEAKAQYEETGNPARAYRDFTYQTRTSWSCERRVIGKAEQLPGRTNLRFVVTSLSAEYAQASVLYEQLYCARGDMENRIKEQQLDLFADRTSRSPISCGCIFRLLLTLS